MKGSQSGRKWREEKRDEGEGRGKEIEIEKGMTEKMYTCIVFTREI